jgi:hypothetical protein
MPHNCRICTQMPMLELPIIEAGTAEPPQTTRRSGEMS